MATTPFTVALVQPLAIPEAELERQFAPLAEAGAALAFRDCRGLADDEIVAWAHDATVLVVANMPISSTVIDGLPHLKMISVAFTGVDHIPMDACARRGIVVSNAQGYATASVVELTFGLLLAVLRRIVPADRATRSGEGSAAFHGLQLAGRTFGVVGAGAIGSAVARVALAFGCRVLVATRTHRPELESAGASIVDLTTLLAESDIVSLHVPLTEGTRGLIGARQIASMKRSAILINTARGPVVDSAALAEALGAGRIAGAGLDVFDTEPPLDPAEPLLHAPNVVVTPHTAYATAEAFRARAEIVFANISNWVAGTPTNVKTA